DPPAGRSGRLGPRPDVPRHRPRAGARRGALERRRDRADPGLLDPAPPRPPDPRPDLLPRPARARLRRLRPGPAGLAVDQPHPAGPPPPRRGRVAGGPPPGADAR